MRAQEKAVSQERMAAILAKHAAPKAEVSVEPPVSESAKPQLMWKKPEKYSCITECGRYSVAKIYSGTIASYEVWKLTPSANWFAHLAVGLESFEAAKARAQQDSER